MGRYVVKGAVMVAGAGLGLAASVLMGAPTVDGGRSEALAATLDRRGLEVDRGGILWLEGPRGNPWAAVTRSTPVVMRARPSADEPHDIFLTSARLTAEGSLMSVGPVFNLTETTGVDELAPIAVGPWVAFAEATDVDGEAPSTIRLLDLRGAADDGARAEWSRRERLQAAITRWQATGRRDGIAQYTYRLEAPPASLTLDFGASGLRLAADGRRADIALSAPLAVPEWLTVEAPVDRRPGNLVTWAVDRVRGVVGDEMMQYVKAIAFSAKDVLASQTEELTGDTGAEAIAEDLGRDELAPVVQRVPTDPDIGFPPPPLEPWVTPSLEGEGQWNGKTDDPFIHHLPGLPPTFVTTYIRGDRRRKATRVYIALWDPRVVQLNMMAGTAEPKSATGATGPGVIPREPKVLRRVAAAMNAGFQALHGEYGMMADGVVYLPPKPYAATVATKRDGSLAFGSWPRDPVIPPDIASYRQNMTALVIDKKFNPYGRTWWGGTPADWEDKTHTTRTGICLTEEGFAGYFYGADLSPGSLARAMIQSRCDYGIALDMNAGHSGLEFYRVGPEQSFEELGRPLRRDWEREGQVRGLEGWSFRARRLVRGMGLMNFPRYIKREGRDFFYLTMRYVLPGPPLDEGGAWTVKGLPQHGFPYALAKGTTEVAGQAVTVLKVDPRMVASGADAPETAADGVDPQASGGSGGGPETVMAFQPPATGPSASSPSLWHTPDAFAVAPRAAVGPAVRIASGTALAEASAPVIAVAAVQDDAGMLVYAEAAAPLPAAAWRDWLSARLGVGEEALALAAPLPLALGGDTDLSGRGVRLAAPMRLVRKAGPGAGRMFVDTPVVPLATWHPLQARRIRYFKKKKKKKEDS
ncbi:MAG: hypothetical protein AAGN82_12370 [Myxococcota bacterium]